MPITTRAVNDEALEPCSACSTRSRSISCAASALRLLAFEHPQQIGGVRQLLARADRIEPFAKPCVRRDDHRHLRGQADAFAQHRLARIVGGIGIEGSKRRSGGAQHIHRMRVLDGADDVEDRRRQFACGLQVMVEFRKLRLVRQFAVQQQPGGFLERRMLGEIVDRIAAVAQLADAAVDEGAWRAVEIDTLQAAVNLDRFVCFSHLCLVTTRSRTQHESHRTLFRYSTRSSFQDRFAGRR